MPELCRFFGIVIAMYFDEHNPPHFHARYGSDIVAIDIGTLRVLEGSIAPRVLGLILEWASQHRQELVADWELAQANSELKKIDPLV